MEKQRKKLTQKIISVKTLAVRGDWRQMIPGDTEETVDETETGKDGGKEGWEKLTDQIYTDLW